MSFESLLVYTGEILKRTPTGTEDDEGVEEVEFISSGEVSCWIEPFISLQGGVAGEEHLQSRDTIQGRWRLLLKLDVDIEAYDRFLHDGRTFKVDGNPETARGARGPDHYEVNLYWLEG